MCPGVRHPWQFSVPRRRCERRHSFSRAWCVPPERCFLPPYFVLCLFRSQHQVGRPALISSVPIHAPARINFAFEAFIFPAGSDPVCSSRFWSLPRFSFPGDFFCSGVLVHAAWLSFVRIHLLLNDFIFPVASAPGAHSSS
jgi:hypothetical protein